jgi:hypothetical protein
MAETFSNIPDDRASDKTKYSVHDVLMSGFAMMFFQDPSLLQFQKRMEKESELSNLQTIFGVKHVPKDSQMRELIDSVNSKSLRPIFKQFFFQCQRAKSLEQFQILDRHYLCSIDGTQFFGSNELHCDHCLEKTHKKNSDQECKSYSHQALQAAIVHPDVKQVIPLMPEEIRNEDGSNKQDCEINAGKRLINDIHKEHPQLPLIILGDGLYSKQPFIETLQLKKMSYILTAKPDDHKIMMEWVAEQKEMGELKRLEKTDDKGRHHLFEWIENVPLNGNAETLEVNFFRYQLTATNKKGVRKVTYKNSWVTDLDIIESNIETLVEAGRCRWKIENECFNTLKNQGYNIEHNYGHGENNLSFNFYLLTLLAFYFHQIFELTDHLFKKCRVQFGSKTNLWNVLRSAIKLIFFVSWQQLLTHALDPPEFRSTAPG